MEKPIEIIFLQHELGNIELFISSDEDIESSLKLNKTVIINKTGKIIGLNLNYCKIENLALLSKFEDLEYLFLSNNLIKDIKPLKNLKKLKILDLFQNQIEEIENLENLENLEDLNLGVNKIKLLKGLNQCKKLKSLYFDSNQIEKIENLEQNTDLKFLYLSFNKIKKIENLDNLKSLVTLGLSGNQIKKIENLDNLTELFDLSLSHNQIENLENLENLESISYLLINGNLISKIENLEALERLHYLQLGNNKIKKIENLSELKSLSLLFLEENNIEKIEFLFELLNIKNLTELMINGNPFIEKTNLKFESGSKENHLNEILSFLERYKETNKIKIILPVKVLFFGNHASGKSTFLNYFLDEGERKIKKNISSTHILNIHSYKKGIDNSNLPKAILFDFGGQDYYHGVYKAFVTNDSINLIFWKKENDKNQSRFDNEIVTLKTQDFNRNYWLYQLNYFYDKNLNETETQPVYLIQTHADKEKRETINENCEQLHVENEFYISLNNESLKKNSHKASLDYFEQTLNEKIEEKRIEKEEPQWYVDFINYILSFEKHNATRLTTIKKEYKRKENENFLSDDLKQLSKQGLVLFYPNNEKLKNYVWLNPNKVVDFIHSQILSKEFISSSKGKVPKDIFESKVTDNKLIELLKENKVLFLDNTNPDKATYIIPGYLPLAKSDEEEYFMLSDFEKPNFVLKFDYFIPFGFINQLICFYGENPEKKVYWRDQLLFTTKNQEAKVLIQLDFDNLEIKVNIKIKNVEIKIDEIEKMIFNDIIIIYHQKEEKLKEEKNYEKISFSDDNKILLNLGKGIGKKNNQIKWSDLPLINDLYISTDNISFVSHLTLEDNEKTRTEIISYSKDSENKINKSAGKIQSSILYKNFTTNTNIKNMKKIFISYSNKDYGYLEKLKTHLSPFSQLQVLESWDCTKLQTGNWHEQIQNNLKDADIVIFMLSANFLESSYILSEELLPSFKEVRENSDKKLLFVVVKSFAYNALSKYSDLTGVIDLNGPENVLLELTKHQFIPYEIKNIGDGEKERKLTPIKKWEDEDDAYVEIINQLMSNI